MTNKKFRVGVLTMVLVFGIGATSAFAESNIQNWISGEISVFGAGVRYERMLNEQFSVGGIASYHILIMNLLGVQAFGRFYPWASNFYAEVGLGFGSVHVRGTNYIGMSITPGIGWRIDVGEPGRFFLNPSINLPIVLGQINNNFINLDFRPAFGMGFAF